SVALDLLANDTDVDGDPLTMTLLAGPLHDTLTPPAVAGGLWTYTPNPDFFGRDSLVYSITDNLNPAAGAIVFITVTPENDAPVLTPIADLSIAQGDVVSIALSAIDVDHAAAELTFSLVSGPEGATLSPDGGFVWSATGSGPQA